jgi:hypothetical protein
MVRNTPDKSVTARNFSQIDTIQQLLQQGKSISPLEAVGVYGITRLASIVHDLRHSRGMAIKTTIKRDPVGRTYAEYRLHDA